MPSVDLAETSQFPRVSLDARRALLDDEDVEWPEFSEPLELEDPEPEEPWLDETEESESDATDDTESDETDDTEEIDTAEWDESGQEEPEPAATTRRSSSRHPVRRWLMLFVIVVALVAGSVKGLTWWGQQQSWQIPAAASSSVPADLFAPANPVSPAPVEPAPTPHPSAACIASILKAVPSGKDTLTGQVRDVASGDVLWSRSPAKLQEPASNEKLLTTLALADALGPAIWSTTFKTSVVAGSGNRIYLVGSGDPYLPSTRASAKLGQPATLNDLAAATAKALLAKGQKRINLSFDDTAFTGPSWNPGWQPSDVSEVTRTSALWVDQGKKVNKAGDTPGIGSAKPAVAAAQIFAKQLKAHGVTVASVAGSGSKSPQSGVTLASIDSMPVMDIISHTLELSDNSAAEVLLRQVAIARGKPGSFQNGANAVASWLKGLGLSVPGLRIVDGSGLSWTNQVPAQTLAGLVAWAGKSSGPAREVLTHMPVAAVSGTLSHRFTSSAAGGGRGWVRAKTGSLSGVSTLSGYTVTARGQVLAFSFMINKAKYAETDWLDRLASALTTSKC